MRHCTSSLFSLRLSTLSVRFRFSTCARYVTPDLENPCQGAPNIHNARLTRRSLPLRSSVRSAPNRGNVSSARTLSNSAALGPSPPRAGAPFTPTPSVLGPGAGCRVVTPPCELDVMIGTGWPVAESGFGGCVAGTAARFDRGIYGV